MPRVVLGMSQGTGGMDFGVDRLIEMFEERFGKLPATALLALIGLAAAGWAIHSIAVFIVAPSWHVGLAIFGWVQSVRFPEIHAPTHLFDFKSKKWIELGMYLYGIFAALSGLFILERVWVKLFHRSHVFTHLLAPRAFRYMWDLENENIALRTELAKYLPAEDHPVPGQLKPPTET